MKKIILSFFLVFLQTGIAQKKYNFDYVLEFNTYKTEKHSLNTYLVNSKDNSFLLHYKFKNDSCLISMIDRKGLSVNSKCLKNDFIRAETISNDCSSVTKFENPFRFKIKEYFFIEHKDTLLKNKYYHHYSIKSNKSLKYQKRKNIAEYHYIVDRESNSFLPFLMHTTPFNEWVEEKNIPNGILYMFYSENLDGKVVFKMELKKIVKIDKNLTIPIECDYTLN